MVILHKLLLEHEKFEPILCLSGQHTYMVTEVLDIFDVIPDYCCDVKRENNNLAYDFADMTKALQDVVGEVKPQLIIVQGDTLTSYCGSFVAFLSKTPLAHVEAGLRTYNKWSPYPEEAFRKFNDYLADIHFAPTDSAKHNLISEQIEKSSIHVTGNTGIDALLYIKRKLKSNQISISVDLQNLVSSIKKRGDRLMILTVHRREGQDVLIPQLLNRLNDWIIRNDCSIVFPVHPNPKIQALIDDVSLNASIYCIKPLPYHEFIWTVMQSDLILSDSGGIQEEAPYLDKPIIVIRDNTERNETIELSQNGLVDFSTLEKDLENKLLQQQHITDEPYGDGNAASKIVEKLEAFLK